MFKYFKLFLLLFFTFYFLNPGAASADVLGQAVLFNVNPEYEHLNRSRVSATLVKISSQAYWYVSDEYWNRLSDPARVLFLSDLSKLADEFDNRIYPIQTQFWGSEPRPGVDNDLKITVLVTELVNPAAGYFDSTHLYKINSAPESNEREMVFLDVDYISGGRAKIFLGHEFQHLIAFYQKDILRDSIDDVWLNEVRAEYSPRLLGYDDDYTFSNIRRRAFAFEQNPSDPLGEWKNEASDYGSATMFLFYLVDHYGDKILSDSLKSVKANIESINEALLANGFTDTFSDIFSNWTVANVLNDESAGPKYSYKFQHLKNFKISPTQNCTISNIETIISVSNSASSWQPAWYEFSTPVSTGSNLNLKIDFSADSGTKFKVPYIAFSVNGKKEIGFIPITGSTGTLFIKNLGSEVYKVIVVPADHSKTFGFTENEPAVSYSLKVQLTAEFIEIPTATPTPQVSNDTLIKLLMDQITELQNKISQLQTNQPVQTLPISGSSILTRSLFVGSQGNDVRWLQDFLNKNGFYPESKITGYFGDLTKNAVIRFQQKYRIFPQIGYVGPKTIDKIRKLNQ